jgi:hypothetical protein
MRLSRTGLLPKVGRDRRSGLGRPMQCRSVDARFGFRQIGFRAPRLSPRASFLRPGPFPPPSPPPFLTALFEGFTGTADPSDALPVPRQLRLLDFLSRPGIARATAGQTRPPKFRRVPFRRDMVSDPGRVAAPRIAVPTMLLSTVLSGSASAVRSLSGLNTDPIGSLCTLRERRHQCPRNTRYRAACYSLTRAGFAPARPRQLAWRTNTGNIVDVTYTARSGIRI